MKKILEAVTAAYIEAVYFTDTGDSEQPDSSIEPSNEFYLRANSDCCAFLQLCIERGLISEYQGTWESFGHNFWITRNGHGTGFWDRGMGEIGDKLTKSANTMGEAWTYEGDDGLLYFG